jgi:outer membrane protein
MKNLLSIIAFFFIASSSLVFSQAKFKVGHINTNDLLLAMPERKTAETQIQQDAKNLEKQLQAMTTEYQTKVAEYQAGVSTMTQLIKDTKAKEITDLEKRIQDFQMSAQEDLEKREKELLQPIIDKAKKAIEEVASKNGYTYIIDSSSGILLVSPDTDDILSLVKKHMGLSN